MLFLRRRRPPSRTAHRANVELQPDCRYIHNIVGHLPVVDVLYWLERNSEWWRRRTSRKSIVVSDRSRCTPFDGFHLVNSRLCARDHRRLSKSHCRWLCETAHAWHVVPNACVLQRSHVCYIKSSDNKYLERIFFFVFFGSTGSIEPNRFTHAHTQTRCVMLSISLSTVCLRVYFVFCL